MRSAVRSGKIFGIGLSRTGTKSLTAALGLLGYKAGHYDAALRAVTLTGNSVAPDYAAISAWDALTDIPMAAVYRALDDGFPGSKFILTMRDQDSWLESCERHYAEDRTAYLKAHNVDLERVYALRSAVYGRARFDQDVFLAAYKRHNSEVIRYFRSRREDFLVLDLISGEGWPELCGFLGSAPPKAPFPHENASIRRATLDLGSGSTS